MNKNNAEDGCEGPDSQDVFQKASFHGNFAGDNKEREFVEI